MGLFNKWCLDNRVDIWKQITLDPRLIPYVKINSKWIARLNIKNKTIQVLEENMDEFIFSFDREKDCLTMTHKPEAKKEKIQLKKFSWQKK